MSSTTLSPTLIAKLKQLAEQTCWGDDDNEDSVIDDFAGGNVDDAFEGGERTGETFLAREILDEMEIPYELPGD